MLNVCNIFIKCSNHIYRQSVCNMSNDTSFQFDSTGIGGHKLVGKQLFFGPEMIIVYMMVT